MAGSAMYGIEGMKNYGYDAEAKELVEKMFQNAEGLLGDGPIRENYNPLTGEGFIPRTSVGPRHAST
mgnify:CR=1 FL=1